MVVGAYVMPSIEDKYIEDKIPYMKDFDRTGEPKLELGEDIIPLIEVRRG